MNIAAIAIRILCVCVCFECLLAGSLAHVLFFICSLHRLDWICAWPLLFVRNVFKKLIISFLSFELWDKLQHAYSGYGSHTNEVWHFRTIECVSNRFMEVGIGNCAVHRNHGSEMSNIIRLCVCAGKKIKVKDKQQQTFGRSTGIAVQTHGKRQNDERKENREWETKNMKNNGYCSFNFSRSPPAFFPLLFRLCDYSYLHFFERIRYEILLRSC